jgi:hypothetical protein
MCQKPCFSRAKSEVDFMISILFNSLKYDRVKYGIVVRCLKTILGLIKWDRSLTLI